MKVLVTGGTSLLGRHVVSLLADRGDSVTVLQRRPSELGVREVLGDITDRQIVQSAVDRHDAVIHLAARVGVVGTPAEFDATNVEGTRAVLAAMENAGVPRLVYVSSPSVAHTGHPLVGAVATPADPVGARGEYSRSKARAELLVLASELPEAVAIRPHLVWGPGDQQLVGRIVERGRTGRLALVGRGLALIDTTYIDNAADAIVAALDRADQVAGRPLVVSNGEPRTVAEMVQRILNAAGVDSSALREIPRAVAEVGGSVTEAAWRTTGRLDEPPATRFLAEQLGTAHWFDQRHTRELLNWSPRVTLDEGFERLRASFSTN